jgi:hypothetical protein
MMVPVAGSLLAKYLSGLPLFMEWNMTSEQKNRYEEMKKMAKEELDHLDKELSEEVIRARRRIEDLQKAKKAVKQIYDNACALLGVKSVIEMKDYGLGDVEKHA